MGDANLGKDRLISRGVPAASPKTGIVLSGGGMRGAYEVGTLVAIMEVLGCRPEGEPAFRVLSGTSVGAINAAYLAANAHRGDHGIPDLATIWSSLQLDAHLRVRPFGLMRWPRRIRSAARSLMTPESAGTSLLDASALELVVRRSIEWERLHENVAMSRVSALLIAALHVASGRTTIFAEVAPTSQYRPSPDPRRRTSLEPIEAEHVLASAAIPLLFPTRRVGAHYYCDGGLRFNTPIAPAIRAGAERLLIISVRHEVTASEAEALEALVDGEGADLSPSFLVGKLLNALLLDPVAYDLGVLNRLNQLMELLEETLSQEDLERVQRVLYRTRGAPYRRLKHLVFTPSLDLGKVAGDYIRANITPSELGPLARYLTQRAVREAPQQEADWASYLLFDGGFAARLLDLGYEDGKARREEILRFFDD